MVLFRAGRVESMDRIEGYGFGDLRVRLGAELKQRFDAVLVEHKISQVTGTIEIVRWFCSQLKELRALILGQIPEKYVGMIVDAALRELAPQAEGRVGASCGASNANFGTSSRTEEKSRLTWRPHLAGEPDDP